MNFENDIKLYNLENDKFILNPDYYINLEIDEEGYKINKTKSKWIWEFGKNW